MNKKMKETLSKIISASTETPTLGELLNVLEDGETLKHIGITDTNLVEDIHGFIYKKIKIYSKNELMRMDWIK